MLLHGVLEWGEPPENSKSDPVVLPTRSVFFTRAYGTRIRVGGILPGIQVSCPVSY